MNRKFLIGLLNALLITAVYCFAAKLLFAEEPEESFFYVYELNVEIPNPPGLTDTDLDKLAEAIVNYAE